ncbi:MAG: beta-3-deoxy-D-manno-oct-2-ulosonic acid transferase [Sphingomonas fennica]
MPPFPGIRPPAIEQAGAGAAPDVAIVAAALAAARVGGRFWGRQATGAPRLVVATERVHLAEADEDSIVVAGKPGIARRAADRGLAVAPADADPWSLIDGATAVAGDLDHEVAILALAAGKAARIDAGARAALLHWHLIAGRSWRDPYGGDAIDIVTAIERLAFWRRWIDANRGIVAGAGIAWWKRAAIDRFLWDGARRLPREHDRKALARARAAGGALAVWPAKAAAGLAAEAAAAGVATVRIEDGFLRSPGLGADLMPPLSVVLDRAGIYYDPGGPSDLEAILATADFPPVLTARAAALRARIVAGGVGKYGASATDAPLDLAGAAGRRVVLVPGQVEDDQSVLLGGDGLGNLALLARVRAAEPDAFILFRPHPDVEAGHRKGAVADADALAHVDRVSRGGALASMLAQVDAVHVLSSLTGFEALLRGREVAVHGRPFYAGWGLTRDLGSIMLRRNKKLTLDELVAGALILYPRYLDPAGGLPCPVETYMDNLPAAAARPVPPLVRLRRLQGILRRRIAWGYLAR